MIVSMFHRQSIDLHITTRDVRCLRSELPNAGHSTWSNYAVVVERRAAAPTAAALFNLCQEHLTEKARCGFRRSGSL